MPLRKGTSKEITYWNFKELKNSGYSEAQAWAIALSKARKSSGKKGR